MKNRDTINHQFAFNTINYATLALSLILTILGFWLLSRPPVDGPISMTVAPIILIINYLIVTPFAILYRGKV